MYQFIDIYVKYNYLCTDKINAYGNFKATVLREIRSNANKINKAFYGSC